MPGASEESVHEGGSRSAFVQARVPAGNGGQEREGRGSGTGVGSAASGPGQHESSRPAIAVLADRIAASLVHHEPGWRLPRHTALARRYNVSTAEIDAAVEELSTRHLVRRLPDGQLYRVSPAEYLDPDRGRAWAWRARRPDGRGDRVPEPAGLLAPGSRGHRVGAADSAR